MSEPLSVLELIDIGERVLDDSTHIDEDHDTRLEAEQLLAHALDIPHDDIDHDLEAVPPRRIRERYLSWVARRCSGEPLPFLLGYTTFYGLELKVRPGAFVPRSSSELTVDRAVRRAKRKRSPVVVDICAGAAPIALAIAHELPDAEVWALDISEEGLAQGRENAKALGVTNVRFRVSDMYNALPASLEGRVDIVTGHVPYVPADELDTLPTEVREYEPLFTLTDDSQDGLTLMRRAVGEAPQWLAPDGWLLLEMSDDLPPTIRSMIGETDLEDKGVASDNDGLSVVVEARKPKKARKR